MAFPGAGGVSCRERQKCRGGSKGEKRTEWHTPLLTEAGGGEKKDQVVCFPSLHTLSTHFG